MLPLAGDQTSSMCWSPSQLFRTASLIFSFLNSRNTPTCACPFPFPSPRLSNLARKVAKPVSSSQPSMTGRKNPHKQKQGSQKWKSRIDSSEPPIQLLVALWRARQQDRKRHSRARRFRVSCRQRVLELPYRLDDLTTVSMMKGMILFISREYLQSTSLILALVVRSWPSRRAPHLAHTQTPMAIQLLTDTHSSSKMGRPESNNPKVASYFLALSSPRLIITFSQSTSRQLSRLRMDWPSPRMLQYSSLGGATSPYLGRPLYYFPCILLCNIQLMGGFITLITIVNLAALHQYQLTLTITLQDMKQTIQCFHELQASVSSNTKDGELARKLEQSLVSLNPAQVDMEVYSRLMLSIYDLSNSPCLLAVDKNKQVHPHGLALQLKCLCLHMIRTLIDLLHKTSRPRLDRDIEIEALEIIILCTRVLLDAGEGGWLAHALDAWGYCDMLYLWEGGGLGADMHLLYVLNKLDLLRLMVDEPSFSMPELLKTLQLAHSLPAASSPQAEEYIQAVTQELALKLLRAGKTEVAAQLGPYLPRDFTQFLSRIGGGDVEGKAQGLGEVYEMYWMLCDHGMEGVCGDLLEGFLTRQHVYEGHEIFEAILLLDQPLLLELWFGEANRRTARPPNYLQSFQCLVSLLAAFVSRWGQQERGKQEGLVRACRQAMLALVREPKDSALPLNVICTYLCKFVAVLVMGLYSHEGCLDLLANLELISNKHGLVETHKTALTLHLYCNLLNDCKDMETYNKFVKATGQKEKERNQSIRLLKSCAEVQLGLCKSSNEFRETIKNRPQFYLLFCEPKDKMMMILSFDRKDFFSLGNIFQLYLTLMEENSWDDANLELIANHLENLLLTSQFSILKGTQESASKLKNCLGRFIQKQNPIFSMLFLYFICFAAEFEAITKEQYGIVLNKFSKILKMLDLIRLDNETVSVLKIITCKSSQKFKAQALDSNGKCSPEAGEIIFLQMIYRKSQQWVRNQYQASSDLHKASQMFVKFCLFEILCLNNRNEQLEQMIDQEQNPQLQQLFSNSQFIPRKLKIVLLRKLFKSDLMAQGSQLTLKDLKELILLAESPEESLIYVTSAIKMYGEKGKKFVSLLAQENSKVGEVCLQLLSSEFD